MENKLSFFVPINKLDEEQRMVYGIATCSKLDNQNEIVDYSATKEALKDYSNWRNIREMHKPSAVGIAPVLELRDNSQELYIGAKIIDDQAWAKCKEGVYKGFSIGGEVLNRTLEMDKASGKAVNRVTKYMLNEISVVDRPANPACKFQTVKRDSSIHVITIEDDPLKSESVKAMEKAIILAKRVLSKEELSKLPDDKFGLIKVTMDGETYIKHRSYPLPDRIHAVNMIRKMSGAEELSSEEKEKIHSSALTILGKKHNEVECPYCINQKLFKGGVELKELEKKADVAEIKKVADIPERTETSQENKEAPKLEDVSSVNAVPAANPIDQKLDRIISILESLIGEEKQEATQEEVRADMDEDVKVEDADEDADEEIKSAEEVAEETGEAKTPAPAVEPAVGAEKKPVPPQFKGKDECGKVAKVVKPGLMEKIKAIVEPIAKENRDLKERIEKMEKQPLPRKEAKEGDKAMKVEKYQAEPKQQDMKIEKRDMTFSDDLVKDISKAQDLRKSNKALNQEEETFCKRVAERMLEERLAK